MKHLFTILMLLTIAVSQAQYPAGAVDTTFILNNDGVPLSTNGYFRAMGVEVVGNSVYYAFSTSLGLPALRKFDFQGNEDESWYTNQVSTWGAQFATFCLEPEKDATGNYTGEFFISGRNSAGSMVNQGVRFLNKINADGTRDLNFVCPNTSWINICSAIYHDWENNKLYYSYQSGYTQTIVSCDPNTGQVLQTLTLPSSTGLIKKIVKMPGTNNLAIGGDLNFTHNGNQYNGLFKLTEQFTIAPIEGITNLSSDFIVSDILFVNDTECDGTSTGVKVYVAGSGTMMSGVSGLRGIARFTLTNNTWTIDSDYNAGCSGTINDIVYYNCHLIATGNFASSMPTGPYTPVWTPKVTAFTSEGQISPEFKKTTIGYGLGGVYTAGFENNFGQGTGLCLAVNPSDDDNDRWEIFVGGTFVSVIQGSNVIKQANYTAKLYGFRSAIDPKFTYCLDDTNNGKYILSTFNTIPTSGCEKWELFKSTTPNSNWTLIDTKTTSDFISMELEAGVWYKIVRTVTECGNSCSSSYIFYREVQNCEPQNMGTELRLLTTTQQSTQTVEPELTDISIYPNPAFGLVTITDGYGAGFRNLDIYNSLGTKVLTTTVNTEIYQIDMSKFPSGVYMIVVTAKEGVKKQQVVKG
jgi:hypothetical protein